MRIRERLARFMAGRYGIDALSRALLICGIVLWVISAFCGKVAWLCNGLYFIALALVVYGYVRTFSKNISKRYAENVKYCQFIGKIKDKFRREKYLMDQRKDYRIFSCPGCGQKVRIPKGKGKIEISCPKCKTKFIKKA